MYEVSTKFALWVLQELLDADCPLFEEVEFTGNQFPRGGCVISATRSLLEAVKAVPELHKMWLGFWGPGRWY